VKILYSFNKRGAEAEFWQREIAQASDQTVTFVPFNHDPYVHTGHYIRAQLLDNLYYERHPGLLRLYDDVQKRIRDERIDVLLVDNCPPYHPDWLRKLSVSKALRIADGPITAYDRDFAYVHAYDLIVYHSPAYSRDMGMDEKLRYVGARRAVFWSHGVFDAAFDPTMLEEELFACERDVDVIFVGALLRGKMSFLAQVKRALGSRCRLHGLATLKQNLYFNVRHGLPGWVTPIAQSEYAPLYRRAKIGFNVHNRGKFTIGSYRMFELPANGVMQLCDGDEYLDTYFDRDNEVVGYSSVDDLVDKIKFYLSNEAERSRIALNGYRRVMRDYRIGDLLRRLARTIETSLA
jgi:spore maturation protein CgeB